jgi:hypothetical protein
MVMALARTSASSRLIVSSGPKLLCNVISPSVDIAYSLDNWIIAIAILATTFFMKRIFATLNA